MGIRTIRSKSRRVPEAGDTAKTEEYLLSSAKDFLNKGKGILKLSFING